MPRRKNSSTPPKAMTWRKALPVLAVCLVFDALRFMFEQFWFFGPAIVGLLTSLSLGGGVIGKVTGTVVAIGVGALGMGEIVVFGVIMAMAVGFFGWLIVGLLLLKKNARIFKANALNGLKFLLSLGASEVPFVGSLPMLTIIIGRMYSAQIKKEQAALKQWEKEQAAISQAERQKQIAEFSLMRDAQMAQEEESQENETEREAALEEEVAAKQEQEETPEEEVRKAA